MARKKLTQEEARLKKKEYDKRRREAMKNNLKTLEKLKEDERRKYITKKEKKLVKLVSEMSKREHRQKKKQWKLNTQARRKRLKQTNALERHLEANSPPESSENDEAIHLPDEPIQLLDELIQVPDEPIQLLTKVIQPILNKNKTVRKEMGRKKVRRDRSKLFKENTKLKKEVASLKARAERYKKRYQNMKKKVENSPKTPNSKVKRFLGNEKVSPAVRKQLLFGEVVNQELTESYQSLKKSQKGRQMFYSVVKGKILKKYRLINYAHGRFLRYKSLKKGHEQIKAGSDLYTFKCKSRGNFLSEQRKTEIVMFYERDDNSKLLPGRKDCLTQNKQKKQKRLLCENLKMLYTKFLCEVDYYVSYTSFVHLKPFYVQSSKVEDRNTCACLLHVNTALVISKLNTEGVFVYKRGSALLKEVVCDLDNEVCLNRTCTKCKSREIEYHIEDEYKIITLKKWTNEKQTINVKGKEKVVRKPVKKELTLTLKCLIKDFAEEIFPKYLTHIKNISHQYQHLKKVKDGLDEYTAYIHVDFSENYACKYNEEIQAVHFGGGREQLTLHTGVLYIMDKREENPQKKTLSFCSLSKSLRHDTAAVWAHLEPIFKWALELNPDLKYVHMQSDGVVTQYKNKTMFDMISSNLHMFLPSISYFTWNYSVSAHGKGAPDVVGGTLKRSADRLVAQGQDIMNLLTFKLLLEERCKGITLFEVLEENIKTIDGFVQSKDLKPFPGTLKVHQVVYNSTSPELQFRSLSCFEGECKDLCKHYSLGSQFEIKNTIEDESITPDESIVGNQEEMNIVMLSEQIFNEETDIRDQDESGIDLMLCKQIFNEETDRDPSHIQAGVFILAVVKGNQNQEYKYVAVCQDVLDDNGEVEVTFLRSAGNKECFKTVEDDVAIVHFTDIISILPPPNIVVSGDRISFKFEKKIDVNEKPYI